MYCGDETGAYIGDIGSHTCRFGYGGEDSPKWVVPSYVARYGSNNNNSNNDSNSSTIDNNNNSNQQRSSSSSSSSSSSRYYMPTSCYSPRLAEHQIDSIMRLAAFQDNESTAAATTALNLPDQPSSSSSLHPLPQVDPTAFLQQGDVVQNWDAFEEAWQASFDVLRVRDKYKHTTGGGGGTQHPSIPFDGTTPTATIAGTGGGEMGLSSTTLRSQPTSDNNDHQVVHPLFCVTPGATHTCGTKYNAAVHRDQLVRTTEILMEQLNAPAVFCAPTPMLGSFSLGRQTALVVDIGAGGCRVTPMVDGLVVKQAQRRNGRGSDYLAHVQWNAILQSKQQQQQQQPSPSILPRFMIRTNKPNVTPLISSSASSRLLYQWGIQDLMYEFRTSHHVSLAPWQYDETLLFQDSGSSSSLSAVVAPSSSHNNNNSAASASAAASAAGMESSSTTTSPSSDAGDEGMSSSAAASDSIYTLPDGTLVDLTSPIGKDLCRIPELLFTDACPFLSHHHNNNNTTISLMEHDSLSNLPLHKLIHASLLAVADVDVRKELCHHILLVGGGSLIPQLEQRLSADVKRVVPSLYQKCRVVASRHHIERSCAAWLGASVLTSLGSFQQLWLSRTEYDEYGVHLSIQRFP